MRRISITRSRPHSPRLLRSGRSGIHEHRWAASANVPLPGNRAGASHSGVFERATKELHTAAATIPDRQCVVLRDAIVTGTKIFRRHCRSIFHTDIWGGVAQQLVARHLEARKTTLEAYTPVFNQAVALNAKSLIVIMVFTLCRGAWPGVLRQPASVYRSSGVFAALLRIPAAAHVPTPGCSGCIRTAGRPGIGIGELRSCALHWRTAVSAAYLYIAAGAVVRRNGDFTIPESSVARFCGSEYLPDLSIRLLVITLIST